MLFRVIIRQRGINYEDTIYLKKCSIFTGYAKVTKLFRQKRQGQTAFAKQRSNPKSMRLFRFFTFFFFVLFFSPISASDEPPLIGQQFYNAGSENISFDEVQLISNLQFKSLNASNLNQGFTKNHYWLHFSLINNDSLAKTYYLETGRPITDEADLYQNGGEEWQLKRSGDQLDFSDRDVAHRSSIFKIELKAYSESEFYLHLKSDGETLSLGLVLKSPKEFWQTNYKQQTFLGFFYGILAISALIYLFFYSGMGEISFLFYGLYVISIALLQGSLDGLIYQFLLPSGSYFNARMVLISALFSNFFLLKYTQHFLNVPKWAPYFNRFFRFFYVLIPLVGLLLFINEDCLALAYPFSNVNGFLSLLLILVTMVFIHFRRKPVDTYFLMGILFLVLGLMGFVMNNLGILPNNFYLLNGVKFGITLEVVFLSLSMTNLIVKLQREKDESQLEALRKYEDINAYKSYFMSNMSHELRTPIMAISGTITELLEGDQDLKLNENYRVIKSASFNLLNYVSNILDFEHIEKNDLEMDNSRSFSPHDVIVHVCDNWELEASKKDLDFIKEIEVSVPKKLMGDEKRFGQIINNLLSNAVKFTHKGSIILRLKSTEVSVDICRLEIEIIDTGIGIKQEELAGVFESFNQMKLNNKRRYGGLGLGLTIVKHLVTLFKGEIDIESIEAQGTKVEISFELPFVMDGVSENDSYGELQKAAEKIKLHILIVEDNVINQIIMKKLLSASEYLSSKIANNGQEALEVMKKERFDLILMDLQMPVMDGYEATEAIRDGAVGEGYRQVPIIAVTANAMQETKQKVLKIGMNDYLTKPVKKDLLLSRVFAHARGSTNTN